MAKIHYIYPVESISGRLNKRKKRSPVQRRKAFRDEHGNVIGYGVDESYMVTRPRDYEKKPPTGAELANIVNEAALRAVKLEHPSVEQGDLEESIEVVIAGYQRKGAVISPEEKKVIAYHEIGHALVAALQKNSAPVHKITIIPRTNGALGYTMQIAENDSVLMKKEELFNKIATITGGRCAEEIIFGSITTGASNDIEQATKIARAMVTRYGMTEEFDMMATEVVTNQYLGGNSSLACSDATATQIDQKVLEIIKKAHAKAAQILTENRDKLDVLAAYLLEKETITGEEFMKILDNEEAHS